MAVLVTGGAGYIGSHTVYELLKKYSKNEIVVVDNLSTGYYEAVPNGVAFYICDLRDDAKFAEILKKHYVQAIVHFAADSIVSQSMKDPLKYYGNNVLSSFKLLEHMLENNIDKIVFSSSAAVYGHVEQQPIGECEAKFPVNPYGETKSVIENMFSWACKAYGIRCITLRYFNAAGAHESGEIGENHIPETHLIPLILQVAQRKRSVINVFGNDYDTSDGTCIRDYIHVSDLANAHILALDRLFSGKPGGIYNLGTGRGYSVMEVVDACRRVTAKLIPTIAAPKREGDPAVLLASGELAACDLGFRPRITSIDDIIKSAWDFMLLHPDGYRR